jgi:hypothetical protein
MAVAVEHLYGDPLGERRNADIRAPRIPADHDAHGGGSMTVEVRGGRRVLAVGIEPAIRAAAPLGSQVGVGGRHAGVHIGDDNALALKANLPQIGGMDQRDIPLAG